MQDHERIAQRIDTIYSRLGTLDSEQSFLTAQLANYTCILVSAYLERALVEIVVSYCEKRATPPVSAFVAAQISRFQNPYSDRIVKFIGGLGEPIKERFEAVYGDETQSAVDSVVNNRNNLAHGRNATVTFHMLRAWDSKLRKLVADLKGAVLV